VKQPDPNSMLTWWPRVAPLAIPKPRTALLEEPRPGLLMRWLWQCEGEETLSHEDATVWGEYLGALRRAAQRIGYPVFLRSDHTSHKHAYEASCFLRTEGALSRHLYEVLIAHGLAFGMPDAAALAVREWLDLDSSFTAFAGMPVAAERRYFVRDGVVECHHPYWPAAAIEDGRRSEALPENWRELLAELNHETAEEVGLLTGYAECVGGALPGFWSVDFARAKGGEWFLIDMATGEASWHPEDCPERSER